MFLNRATFAMGLFVLVGFAVSANAQEEKTKDHEFSVMKGRLNFVAPGAWKR